MRPSDPAAVGRLSVSFVSVQEVALGSTPWTSPVILGPLMGSIHGFSLFRFALFR
jgi:hypothetical protein